MKSERREFGKILLFAVLFAMLVFVSVVGCASAKIIYVPTDYSSIQEAIDAASLGDTVFVWNGTYYEDGGVSITKKRITLQGEDANTTTINGKWTADKVVNVTGNYVNVSGFTVAGSTLSGHGIYVEGDNCIISDNNIVDGRYGISLSGSNSSTVAHNNASKHYYSIYLSSSNDCLVSGNIANSNYDSGIYLEYSSNCVLENNIANSNYDSGIYLEYSSNCVLKNNTANSNLYARYGGIYLHYSSNCVLEGNTANLNGLDVAGGSPSIYLYYSSNCVLEGNTANSNVDGIVLRDSSNSKLRDNIANSNSHGIDLFGSSSCILEGNIATQNYVGISLYDSSNCNLIDSIADSNGYGIRLESTSTNNTVTENTLSNNDYGVYHDYSSNNEIYHNNFINNNKQAYDHHGFNDWDKGPIIGGNYWSDHVCHGNPSDGTEPYTGIDTDAGAVDNYPFEDPDGWVTPPQKPSISIYTDKPTYTTGEKMHLGLDVKNPIDSAQKVSLNIYLETPIGRNYTLIDTTVTLPAKLDYSNPHFKVFALPRIPAGTYTWHAVLDDPVTGEIICEDTASWEFVSTGAPTEDITGMLEQTTAVIDFGE